MKIFQSYDYKCTATFLWFTVYIRKSFITDKASMNYVHWRTVDRRASAFSGMSVLTLALCARLSWLLVSF